MWVILNALTTSFNLTLETISMNRLESHRKHYSQLVTAIAGVESANTKLVSAFATVRREDYLGPGPWKIRAGSTYTVTPTDNPEFLYQDVLVALKSKERINNGQPSLHARCLDSLQILTGETVLHIGAGTGYYTALLSELVGASGNVFAYEVDDELAQIASDNLKDRKNVHVHQCSGAIANLPNCDVIYVNAGATRPETSWLDAINDSGRILFPLTSTLDSGGMLLLQQVSEASYSAKFVSPAAFIPCVGIRNEEAAFELADTFQSKNARQVKSFHRGNPAGKTRWFGWDDCWLSTDSI